MISAKTLFQIGGIVNSCHSGSGVTLFGVVVAVWVGVGVLVELFPEKSKQFYFLGSFHKQGSTTNIYYPLSYAQFLHRSHLKHIILVFRFLINVSSPYYRNDFGISNLIKLHF